MFTECESGFYGPKCLYACSSTCKTPHKCHHVTGNCDDGCKDGWQGMKCLEIGITVIL